MDDVLYNPVFNAMRSGDAHLCSGTDQVKYFDDAISPFVGFHEKYENGFSDLFDRLPAGRHILYATPATIDEPTGWKMIVAVNGFQFVHRRESKTEVPAITPVPLTVTHIDEMVQLANLTKPGPFDRRTIGFGHYHGIFENGQLVAMTGQRLHVHQYTEVSAVCTHPNHTGKGYAAALMLHQMELIKSQGKQAILHVRNDNTRAIALYERLGFDKNRVMNFYFMEKKNT
jgi:GNAT superfamily N-acetyltransferase